MAESTEVILARLDERMKTQAEVSKEILQQMRDHSERLVSMEQRVQNVENSLTTQKPVIDDFIEIRHKVVGAGQFGKFVWIAATACVTFLITSRDKIAYWFTTGNVS